MIHNNAGIEPIVVRSQYLLIVLSIAIHQILTFCFRLCKIDENKYYTISCSVLTPWNNIT